MDDREPFQARFQSKCLVCNEQIEEKDWVVYDDDDQVIHLSCSNVPEELWP